MHNIVVAGHLGNDPEERQTPSGQRVISFRLAMRIRSSGQDETLWWRITLWGNRFDRMLPYLRKGSGVIAIGTFSRSPRTYTDRNGETRVSLDLTADRLEFSPFGRSAMQGEGEENFSSTSPFQPASNPEPSPSREEVFPSMERGTKEERGGSVPDEVPF